MAAAILYFYNSQFLLIDAVQMVELHHYAKFCQNWSNSFGDITIFFIFQGGSRHRLGFYISKILLAA